MLLHEAVGKAGGMRQEIADRHFPLARLRLVFLSRASRPDLQLLEGGDVAGNGVVQLKVPLLVEHHECKARDRLRHRIDAEDRILLHRQAALAVALAGDLEMRDLAVAGDERREPRDLAAVDI